MELVETKTGKWYVETSGELHGEVEAALRAYCVTGELIDTDYKVNATLRIIKGTKASIIVFYADSPENYLEFVLDITSNQVLLDKVEAVGGRVNLVTKAYTIALNKNYECQVSAKSNRTIKCAINGATVIKTTAPEEYTAGKHGYGCDGAVATDYTLFDKVYFEKPSHYSSLEAVVNSIRAIDYKDLVGQDGTPQDYYDYIMERIEEASRFFDGATQQEMKFFQTAGIEVTEYCSGLGSTPPAGMYEFSEAQISWKDSAARMFMKASPILSVTSIHKNTAQIGDTESWTAITKYAWFSYGEIVFNQTSIPPKGIKNVRIIYKVGYSTTPIDIKMAVTRLIVNLIHKLVSDRTTTFVSFARPTAINFAMPDILTPDIQGVIKRYKRTSYGEM